METLNLNRIPNVSNPVVHVSQYDIGRVFRFELYEGSSVYTLDGTETIECNVRKLDGNIVTVGVTNTSDSYIDVITTEQMTAIHGQNYGEIVFKKGGNVIGSVNFILQVEQSPLEGGITSDSAIYNLEVQVANYVATEVASQYDSNNVLFDSTPTSGHNTPYTVTSNGIKDALDTKQDLIASKSASGSLIHITDGGDNIPMKSLESEIVAVESGSGEKSPTNPYTISGFNSGKIGVTNDNIEQLWTIDNSFRGEVNFNQIVETSKKSATITPDGTQTYSVVGNRTSVLNVDDIYFIACTISYIGIKTLRAFCLVGSNGYGSPAQDLTGSSGTFGWILKPNSATSLSIGLSNILTSEKLTSADAWTYDNLMCINLTQMFGSTIADYIYSIRQTTGVDFFRSLYPDVYYSYNLGTSELVGENTNTYTFTFGQTVYGGHFDNKGNLVVTHGYIASYNGEPINEPWISSMDNYVPNTSPSTGAQVVYPLTTPTTLSITSQDIPTLSGENNIFSNCGDTAIEYFTNTVDGLVTLINEFTVENATELPISDSDPTDTKSYIDNGLSGKADTSDTYTKTEVNNLLNDKQNKNVLNIVKHYDSGTSSDAITDIITEYGKVNMVFAFDVPLGYFTGCLTFANDNMGSGFIVLSTTGRFWVVSYVSGTITLTELT